MARNYDPANFKAGVGVVLKGDTGESAYEIAVRLGFKGTEQEWLASLAGESAKAAEYTAEAMLYRDSAKESAIASGNYADKAKEHMDATQAIKESIYPEAEGALTKIREAKAEAEAVRGEVQMAASNARTSAEQASRDAWETRYLHGETIKQKNVATNAAERARMYGEGRYWGLYYNKEEVDDIVGAESVRASVEEARLDGLIGSAEAELRGEIGTAAANLRSEIAGGIAASMATVYPKTETYSKAEVNDLVSTVPKMDIKVVDSLPATDISATTIYFVRTEDEAGVYTYTQYLYVDGGWVQLGKQKIDLSDYVTKDGLITMGADAPADGGIWLRPM